MKNAFTWRLTKSDIIIFGVEIYLELVCTDLVCCVCTCLHTSTCYSCIVHVLVSVSSLDEVVEFTCSLQRAKRNTAVAILVLQFSYCLFLQISHYAPNISYVFIFLDKFYCLACLFHDLHFVHNILIVSHMNVPGWGSLTQTTKP